MRVLTDEVFRFRGERVGRRTDVYEPICLFHGAAGNSGSVEIQNASEIVACMGWVGLGEDGRSYRHL